MTWLHPRKETIIMVEDTRLIRLRLIYVSMTEKAHRASVYNGTTRLYEGYSTTREKAGDKAITWIKENYTIVRKQ